MTEFPSGVVPPPEILSADDVSWALLKVKAGDSEGIPIVLSHEALRQERDGLALMRDWAVVTTEALRARVVALTAALTDLAESVGDFHTSYTCTDSYLVIPDMLDAMFLAQRAARRVLSDGETP